MTRRVKIVPLLVFCLMLSGDLSSLIAATVKCYHIIPADLIDDQGGSLPSAEMDSDCDEIVVETPSFSFPNLANSRGASSVIVLPATLSFDLIYALQNLRI